MSIAPLPVLISWSIAAVFALAGLIHLAMPSRVRAAYARWDFPRGFPRLAATLQFVAAFFLAFPQTRIWGVAVAATILFITIVTLLKHREYGYAVPGMILLAALPPALLAAA